MKKLFSFSILLFIIFNSFGQWTIETVPDPKETGLGFTSNPDGILTAEQVSIIDSTVQVLEDSSKAQIAIIMLQSIGSEVPKTFATNLFNHWGIGDKSTDNGLLILFVMDQRRIEFETGYGTEHVLTDAKCYQIQQEYMVPQFKQANYGQGMIDGVKATVDVLMGNIDEIKAEDYNTSDAYASQSEPYNYKPSKRNRGLHKYGGWVGTYFYLGIFSCGLYLLLLIISLLLKNYFTRYQTMRLFTLYFWFIIFPVPFLILFFITRAMMNKWRNTPRISAKTGKLMHKLSEEEDDKFLKKGQISEERINSVDYDVWISDEPDDVLIQAYKRWFSKYNSCPKCRYKTYYKVYDRVIRSATYSRSGKGEKKYACKNCGHTRIKTYTIPKKTRSSSSSSSSSSSWGGSSSWGSSSSSWGGGSSGGGGAGSSW